MPDQTPDELERLFQHARESGDHFNAIPYFDRLAANRHLELKERPGFDPVKPSIVTTFQPKSGGTFLHNRLLELGYQEFWWCFPHAKCHSYWYTSQRTLQLYLEGGAACQTHLRPDAALLDAFDACGVERLWVHLRNPVESAVSAYHHYRGEGQGEGAVGDERRRAARRAVKLFRALRAVDKDKFVLQQIDWFNEWIAQWLRFDAQQPGRIVFSYHRELADSQRMIERVLRQFGVESPGKITTGPIANDRFRPNPLRDWRQDLSASTRRWVERRVQESLGSFPAFERLWT